MSVPFYTLDEIERRGGTDFDKLLAVIIKQHIERTKGLVGQTLTLIEVALGDSVEGEALKSLVKEAIWANTVRFEETDLIGAVHYFAIQQGGRVKLYKDRDKLGRFLFGDPEPEEVKLSGDVPEK